ncbi:hypothetical protein ACQR1I_35935 [Bradyrhizobium sp. HKCCYLS2038]|uniref:hypothetical protein n=1 Tax=Bradyrhizobium sp. HKCCYLS2038 TaxID=3420764 RepID=UPI003EBE8D36
MTEEEIGEEELAKAFRELLATAAGKRVLFWVLEQCAIYRDAFCGEMTAATNYTLGQQSSGRKIIAKLDEIDPRLYPALLAQVAEIREMDRAAAKATAEKKESDDDLEG